MRRTKIVATLGPASSDPDTMRRLVEAGVDVFRLNFSHGTRETHRSTIHHVRQVCQEVGREVAILQDLCGPKIRVGEMENGAVELVDGMEVTVTTRKTLGTPNLFSTSYRALPRDVSAGKTILLDDGALALEVLNTSGDEVVCRVLRGGMLKDRKGMNLPDTDISSPSVTQKDLKDLSVGLEEEVDFVALSFVRRADDIRRVRKMLEKHGKPIHIIAKIEKPEALEEIEDIIHVADGIMVARGDLGVEMPVERVPVLQKDLILRANEEDKYVITATQMLESMVRHPTPTRAEVTDVANAIVDGSDAVMLSGETAAGDFPLEAVRMMDRVARETESYLHARGAPWDWNRLNPRHPVMDALGHATHRLYEDLDVKAIAAFSASGGTALFLSKSRCFAPVIAFTASREALRRMRLFWGVIPIYAPEVTNRAELRARARDYIRDEGLAVERDRILLVAGTHFGQVGAADAIEIATLAETDQTVVKRRETTGKA